MILKVIFFKKKIAPILQSILTKLVNFHDFRVLKPFFGTKFRVLKRKLKIYDIGKFAAEWV